MIKTIKQNDNSIYIKSGSINGNKFNSNYIAYREIMKGTMLAGSHPQQYKVIRFPN